MNLGLAFTVFGVIFIAELPDKTLIATLLMGSRSAALPVWVGASVAFLFHVAIATVAGKFVGLLPHTALQIVVTVLFLGGAAYLLFVPESAEVEKGAEEADAERPGTFLKVAGTAFGVIFIGEFGDLTQLVTVNFAAKSHQPFTVFVAASLALVCVAGLAVSGGQALLKVVSLEKIRKGGGVVLAAFGLYTLGNLCFG